MCRVAKYTGCVVVAVLLIVLSGHAWGYIDPNVTQTVFYGLGALLLVGLGVVANIVFWPFLFFRKKIMKWFRKRSKLWKVVILSAVGLLLIALGISVYMTFF